MSETEQPVDPKEQAKRELREAYRTFLAANLELHDAIVTSSCHRGWNEAVPMQAGSARDRELQIDSDYSQWVENQRERRDGAEYAVYAARKAARLAGLGEDDLGSVELQSREPFAAQVIDVYTDALRRNLAAIQKQDTLNPDKEDETGKYVQLGREAFEAKLQARVAVSQGTEALGLEESVFGEIYERVQEEMKAETVQTSQ